MKSPNYSSSPSDWRALSAKFANGSLDYAVVREEAGVLFDRWPFPGGASGDHLALLVQIVFALMWGRCGFPHLIVRPKRAAYFATTQVKPDCVNMFEPPWPAFFISLVDSDLYTPDQRGVDQRITSVLVWSCTAAADEEAVRRALCHVGDRMWSFLAFTADGICVFRSKYSYNWDSSGAGADESCWADSMLPTVFGYETNQRDLRLNLLIAQMVAGVCLEFQTVDGVREAAARQAKGKNAKRDLKRYVSATPMPFVLSEDVVVDARRVVHEYHKSGGKSPTVRSFVRPHPRRQHHGPGNALVKIIRVDGFWRGPKGAPIVARSHRWKDGDD